MAGRKPPPPPPGSVVDQARTATRELREAMADAKRETRQFVAELERAAQVAAAELAAAVRDADELKRGFRGIVSTRMESLVKGLEPAWTDRIKAELEIGLAAANRAVDNHLARMVAAMETAQEAFEAKEAKVNELVEWLDETLRYMVTSDLFPHMSALPPTRIVRSDKAKRTP